MILKSIPCAAPIRPAPLPALPPWQILTVGLSVVLSFLGYLLNGITQNLTFLRWLFLLSSAHLGLMGIFVCLDCPFLFVL